MAQKRKKSKLKKRLLQAAVLITLVGALAGYLIPSPIFVRTDEARIGSLSTRIDAQGRARASERYWVWAPVAGTLPRLSVAAGDAVVRDQVLARIVPDPAALTDPNTARQLGERIAAAEAARSRAIERRTQATAALEEARNALRNTEQLAAAGQATASQREQAQLTVKLAFRELAAAGNAVQAAAFDLATAQEALRQLKQGGAQREWVVRAPVGGSVLAVAAGNSVTLGAPLVEISNPSDPEVVAELGAADAAQLSPGQRAVLTPAGSDASLAGRVRRVDPIINAADAGAPQRAQVVIEFAAPSATGQSLGHGREVRVRLITITADHVLKVPAAAVFDDGQRATVYVVEGGRAHQRSVKTGMRNAEEVVIESGLQDGDRVILSPDVRIKDGVRVKTR